MKWTWNFLKSQINPLRIRNEWKDAKWFPECLRVILFWGRDIWLIRGWLQLTWITLYTFWETTIDEPWNDNKIPEASDILLNFMAFTYAPILWAVWYESLED
jgi:hypothetical protein